RSYPVVITEIVPATGKRDRRTVHFLKKRFSLPKGVSVMTTSYYAERANLSRLHQLHPDWFHQQLATALGRSREWVKQWRKRLREEVALGLPLAQVLQGHSRARKHPPAQTPALIVERIRSLRDEPPQGLRRVPG